MKTTTWRVWDTYGQMQEVELPSEYGYAEVRKDLIENCGFPEEIIIKRMNT